MSYSRHHLLSLLLVTVMWVTLDIICCPCFWSPLCELHHLLSFFLLFFGGHCYVSCCRHHLLSFFCLFFLVTVMWVAVDIICCLFFLVTILWVTLDISCCPCFWSTLCEFTVDIICCHYVSYCRYHLLSLFFVTIVWVTVDIICCPCFLSPLCELL